MKTENLGHAARAAAAAAAVAWTAGCVSFPRTGGERKVSETRVENASGILDAMVEPVVARQGRDAVVKFKVSGVLTNSCTTSAVYDREVIGISRFGLFPGVSPDKPEFAFEAFWYNLCMLGAPTLNGLLLEWFRDPASPIGLGSAGHGLFRRSALFGFYSERQPGGKTVKINGEPKTETKRVDSLFLPVGPESHQISVSVDGTDVKYERSGGDCCVRLLGVYPEDGGDTTPANHFLQARLGVPPDYGLKAELAGDGGETVEIGL